MRLKKFYKRLFIISGILIFLSILAILTFKLVPNPPTPEVEKARIALSKATSNKASTYSKELYAKASSLYDSSMANWRKQNKKFIYFRDYDKVRKFANLAYRKALQANENSKLNSNNYNIILKNKIDSLKVLVEFINTFFNRYPLPVEIRSNIAKGKMILKEGVLFYDKGEFLPANKKLNESDDLLSSAYNSAYSDFQQYFTSFSRWEKWAKSAIEESKEKNIYSILIDKVSKKCYIYHSGVKKYEFNVELGRNWVGSKKTKGDKATPEGRYQIVKKLNRTMYNNALLINYPNDEDKENFMREKEKGLIPKTAKIGGGIEIHGSGGKGVDWTEGCIALSDKEMAIVYKIATVGTPVTIVGSIKNLNELIGRQ